MKKNNKGFSLVELIVVVLILGILAVAVSPQVMKWVGKSRVSSDKDNANALKSSVQTALADWQGQGGKIDDTNNFVMYIDTKGNKTTATNWSQGIATDTLADVIDEVTAAAYPKTQYEKLAQTDIPSVGGTALYTLPTGVDVGFVIFIHKDSGKVDVWCKAQTVTD